MKSDEHFMQRCLELAIKGMGLTSPNPLVGSVIVHEGKIIAEGFHHRYGGSHAEVNAINGVMDKGLLRRSTLYVNLEPCSHHGKTPPCSDLIISSGIPRVVLATRDSNPQVAGRGVERLQGAGVKVTEDVLQERSRFLNRRFFTFHEQQRPYIILKWAQTEDGFIDIIREEPNRPTIHWITDKKLKMLVHKWRNEEDAILVGSVTVRNDNPRLTIRDYPGKNPLRVVLDQEGSLGAAYHVFDGTTPTLLYTSFETPKPLRTTTVIPLPAEKGTMPLSFILQDLYQRGVQSIIVEGGLKTLGTFIGSGLWDEARVFTGNKRFGNGLPAPQPDKPVSEMYTFGNDFLRIYYKCKLGK